MRYLPTGPNRTICSVLDEMRTLIKSDPFPYKSQSDHMRSLIEEAQTMANRMEAGLNDLKDAEELREEKKKLIKKIRDMEKKLPEGKDDD